MAFESNASGILRVMQMEVCKLCCLSSCVQRKKETNKQMKKRKMWMCVDLRSLVVCL